MKKVAIAISIIVLTILTLGLLFLDTTPLYSPPHQDVPYRPTTTNPHPESNWCEVPHCYIGGNDQRPPIRGPGNGECSTDFQRTLLDLHLWCESIKNENEDIIQDIAEEVCEGHYCHSPSNIDLTCEMNINPISLIQQSQCTQSCGNTFELTSTQTSSTCWNAQKQAIKDVTRQLASKMNTGDIICTDYPLDGRPPSYPKQEWCNSGGISCGIELNDVNLEVSECTEEPYGQKSAIAVLSGDYCCKANSNSDGWSVNFDWKYCFECNN